MACILIAEDHKFSRHMLTKLVADLGHAVIEAEHGLAALKLLAEQEVDAVIADLHMPEMGAIELLQHAEIEGLNFPTVVVSTQVNSDEEALLLKLGVDHVVSKPFTADDIADALQLVLKRTA